MRVSTRETIYNMHVGGCKMQFQIVMSRYRKPETYYFLRHEVTNCEIKPTYLEGGECRGTEKAILYCWQYWKLWQY